MRKHILEKYRIDAIISLPKGVFLPYTPVKTYILMVSRKKPENKIWCYKIENDGFELTGLRKKILENDIYDLLDKWINKEESEKSWFIYKTEIEKKENKYSLIPEDYNEKFRFKLEQDEKYVDEEFGQIYTMLREISQRMQKLSKAYKLDFLDNERIEKERIRTMFDLVSGNTPPRDISRYFGGDIKFVKVGDLPGSTRNGFIQPQEIYVDDTEEGLTEEGFKESRGKILPKDTVLVAIFANAGKTGILNVEACTNQAIVGLIPKNKYKDKFISEYLHYMILANRDVLEDMARGGNQTNINKTKLGILKIPIPNKKIQKKVIKILNQYSSELYDLSAQRKILEENISRMYSGILVDTLIKQKINEPIEEMLEESVSGQSKHDILN